MTTAQPLMPPDQRLVSVALDHGVFGAGSITTGMDDLENLSRLVIGARPDAVQLSLGAAERLAGLFAGSGVSMVARLDVTNAYSASESDPLFSLAVPDGVRRAQAIGASAVVVNLLKSPSAPGLQRDCLQIVSALRVECSKFGMPMIVEPLVLDERAGTRYGVNGDVAAIAPLVRQAMEMGADLIKADPTDDLSAYDQVVRTAAVPVLVRGGGRIDDEELLARTRRLLRLGAAGVVYGRNVFQHSDPARITARLMEVVHGRV